MIEVASSIKRNTPKILSDKIPRADPNDNETLGSSFGRWLLYSNSMNFVFTS